MNNKLTMKIAAIAALTAWLTSFAPAADFYVSSIHSARNDANPGTSSNAPWSTFEKVKSSWGTTIKPGDTVHLQRGSRWTWSGQWYWVLEQGGTASAPMTIRGDDYGTGTLAIIEKVGGSTEHITFWIRNASYVTFRDFTVDGGMNAGFGTTPFLVAGSSQSVDVNGIRILNMVMRNLGNGTATYNSGIWVQPFNNHKVNNCLFEGNDISAWTAHAINHYAPKTTVRSGNLIYNCTYRNNRIHDPSPDRAQGYVASGIHIAFGGTNNIFEYNYISGHNEMGSISFHNLADDEKGLIVRYNVVVNNSRGSGILFLNDGACFKGTTVQADIYGNVISGCLKAGLSVEPYDWYGGTVNIYNNTFFNNAQKLSVSSGEIQINNQNPINLKIANNIFVRQPYTGSPSVCLYISSGYAGTLTHHNNLYWNLSGSSASAISDRGTSYTVANARNYESTAQNTDPLFTNVSQLPTSVTRAAGASPNGLLPKAGSLAIDKGATLGNAYASSINLVIRPQGTAWDIGAYEVSSGSTPAPLPAAPSELKAQAFGTNGIALNWTDNSANETGFKVERSADNAVFSLLGTTGSNVTAFAHTGVALNTTNYYRVRASSSSGDSDYSAVASAVAGEVISDETGPNFTTAAIQDAWVSYQEAGGQHWGGSHVFNRQIGTGGDIARWTVAVPVPGTYDVFAWWWESALRPPDVPFTITSPGMTSAVVRADQRSNGGRWNLLGAFPFATQAVISVSDAATSGSDVVADAIRLAYRSSAMPVVQAPPPAPSALTVQSASINSVTLSWQDNSVNETGFRIEYGPDGLSFQLAGTVSSNVTSFLHAGLVPLSTNYYRVKAISTAGDSGYSGVVKASPGELILDNTVPGLIIMTNQDAWILHQDPAGQNYNGSHLYNRLAGAGQDSVKWLFSVPAAGTYDLYAWWWDGSARPPDVPIVVTHANGTVTNRVDQRVNGGKWNLVGSYSFASNGSVMVTDGFSSGSDAVADAIRLVFRSSSVPAIEPPPLAPSNLTATAQSSTRITLTWQDGSTDETGFRIERGTNASTFVTIATVSSNLTTYSDTGVVGNLTYYYRVKAYNAWGDSSYSMIASASTPAPLVAPVAPSLLTAVATSTNQITLAWTDNSANETGFKIERSSDGVTFAQIAVTGSNATGYVSSGLTPKTAYSFRIRATNGAGDSPYANVVSATTPAMPIPPAAPSGLTAVMTGTNQITLAWKDNSDSETGFRIERATNGVTFGQIATVGANISNYVVVGFFPGVTNYFRIQSYSQVGNSSYSGMAMVLPGELIVDNLSAGFSTVSGQDSWVLLQEASGQHYGGSHLYNRLPGTGLDAARFDFTVPAEGLYEVYAWWWDGSWRPSRVPYVIAHAGGGSSVVNVDQRTNGGKWVLLGIFHFRTEGSVTITDAVTDGTDIVADAVRLVFRPDMPFSIPEAPTGVRVVP